MLENKLKKSPSIFFRKMVFWSFWEKKIARNMLELGVPLYKDIIEIYLKNIGPDLIVLVFAVFLWNTTKI